MPNLRTLRFDIDGSKMQERLSMYLYRNPALESLHLRLAGKGMGSAGGGKGEALRHELQDALPSRLREIVLEGPKVENIHPAAFKVTIVISFHVKRDIYQQKRAIIPNCCSTYDLAH